MLPTMDWKLLTSTFVAIFLAELGDKTQLATMGLAAGDKSKWSVFLGSCLALVASSAIAVLLGDVLQRWIPAHWIRRGAGLLFITMGILFLTSRVET